MVGPQGKRGGRQLTITFFCLAEAMFGSSCNSICIMFIKYFANIFAKNYLSDESRHTIGCMFQVVYKTNISDLQTYDPILPQICLVDNLPLGVGSKGW